MVATPIDPGYSLSVDAVDRVWAAVDASTWPATRAAYRSEWARSGRWAGAAGNAMLPAAPMAIAAYLTKAAEELKPDGWPRFGSAPL